MSTGMIWTLWTVAMLAFGAVMIAYGPAFNLGTFVVNTALLFVTGGALLTLGAVAFERSAQT